MVSTELEAAFNDNHHQGPFELQPLQRFAVELVSERADLDLAEQTIRGLLVRACTPRQSRFARIRTAAMCLMWTPIPEALLTEGRLPLVLSGV